MSKLFLASERFYDIGGSLESAFQIISAPDKESAFKCATYDTHGTEKESRNPISPMFDIFELGELGLLPWITGIVDGYPENETGGVSIFAVYQDPVFDNTEIAFRELVLSKVKPGCDYVFGDKLKMYRDRYFSFTEKPKWILRPEDHLNLKIPVWVSPKWDSLVEQALNDGKLF